MSGSKGYLARRAAEGLCWRCPHPAYPGRKLCAWHLAQDRLRKRAGIGCKPQMETGIGRKPSCPDNAPKLPPLPRKPYGYWARYIEQLDTMAPHATLQVALRDTDSTRSAMNGLRMAAESRGMRIRSLSEGRTLVVVKMGQETRKPKDKVDKMCQLLSRMDELKRLMPARTA